MIGINKCLSVKVCLLLTWLQSSWKPFEVYIFEMGVNRKFDFRWVWKFCWDLSNVILVGNWLFRWDCVFQVGLWTPLWTMDPLYFMKNPPRLPIPPPPTSTPITLFVVLFLCLNRWLYHFWCVILLNDIMYLQYTKHIQGSIEWHTHINVC